MYIANKSFRYNQINYKKGDKVEIVKNHAAGLAFIGLITYNKQESVIVKTQDEVIIKTENEENLKNSSKENKTGKKKNVKNN